MNKIPITKPHLTLDGNFHILVSGLVRLGLSAHLSKTGITQKNFYCNAEVKFKSSIFYR